MVLHLFNPQLWNVTSSGEFAGGSCFSKDDLWVEWVHELSWMAIGFNTEIKIGHCITITYLTESWCGLKMFGWLISIMWHLWSTKIKRLSLWQFFGFVDSTFEVQLMSIIDADFFMHFAKSYHVFPISLAWQQWIIMNFLLCWSLITIHLLWNLSLEHFIIKVLLWLLYHFQLLITPSSLLTSCIARAPTFIYIWHRALLTSSCICFIVFSNHNSLYWICSLWLDLH